MWKHLPTTVSILIIIGIAFGAGSMTLATAAAGPFGPGEADRVEFVDMPDEFVAMATWAVDLFDEAGLQLPAMTFEYHGDDTEPCGGWRGVHRRLETGSVIKICTTDTGAVTEALVLHETAHAWASIDLPEERKAEFKELRGYEEWRNHAELAWHENGSEQAAEIIVWGLIDRPIGIMTINNTHCEALDAGYRTLTGQAPLHGYQDHC